MTENPSAEICEICGPKKSGLPTWLEAALWLALLGPLFFLIYGGCNAYTATRAYVPSFFFEWERRIPFVPVMIVPYMSIDLFFAGAFFLCREKSELRTLAARILFAFVISAAVFLLFPLRYGWPRPAVDGFLGAVFAPLNAFDQPFNLCPSLHISLRTILWQVYGLRTRPWPWLRWTLEIWFMLIAASTLLVYQHHVIDLLGGYVVALLALRLFRGQQKRIAPTPEPAINNEALSPSPCPSPEPPTNSPPRSSPS